MSFSSSSGDPSKCEEAYLKTYSSVVEERTSIRQYPAFYNGLKPHCNLDRTTPDRAYCTLQQFAAASLRRTLSKPESLFRQA